MKLQFFAWFILALAPNIAGREPTQVGKEEANEITADPFEFMVELFNEENNEYLLSLKCSDLGAEEDLWVSDVVIYWITPDNEGLIVPIRPFDKKIFIIKVQLPQDNGTHEMKVSFCLRNEEGTIQRIYERTYFLQMPAAILRPEGLKIFPPQGLIVNPTDLDSEDPIQLNEEKSSHIGWAFLGGLILGAVLCVAGMCGYAYYGHRDSLDFKLLGKRFISSSFGNIFGKKSFPNTAPQDENDVEEPEMQPDGEEESAQDRMKRIAESLSQSENSEKTVVLDIPENDESSVPADADKDIFNEVF